MSEILDHAREVALKAGQFLKENLGSLTESDIGYKGYIDLVTRIDRESEEMIVREIGSRFPEHGILAEESARKESETGLTWVIDPLDGTTNYVHSFPLFCVSIAVCRSDEPVAGVIYAPCMDELFSAESGQGAHLNGKEIHVSGGDSIGDGFFCTGFASLRNREAPDNIGNFIRVLKRAQGVRRGGSAALELAYVAAGRFEAFWELNLSPWDVAAGVAIIREAGGKLTDMRGGSDYLRGSSILASNSKVHQDLLDLLDPEERTEEPKR